MSDKPVINNRTKLLLLLLAADVTTIVIVFNTALLMPLGLANLFVGLVLGSISLCAGVWTIVQYVRGKRDLPIFLSLCLALIGLVMIVGFFLIWNGLRYVII
jgi:hypothetical protein